MVKIIALLALITQALAIDVGDGKQEKIQEFIRCISCDKSSDAVKKFEKCVKDSPLKDVYGECMEDVYKTESDDDKRWKDLCKNEDHRKKITSCIAKPIKSAGAALDKVKLIPFVRCALDVEKKYCHSSSFEAEKKLLKKEEKEIKTENTQETNVMQEENPQVEKEIENRNAPIQEETKNEKTPEQEEEAREKKQQELEDKQQDIEDKQEELEKKQEELENKQHVQEMLT